MRLFFILFLSVGILHSYAQNPNDCINALVICGDSSIGLDPSGTGFDEFSLPGNEIPSCYNFDQHSIWFKFTIVGSGSFTFDIVPDDGADYDFAIFGPVADCTELGAAIRCSSTNPDNAGVPPETGLNMEETDVTEGPGEDGNGYLQFIDASVGDVYYLLVDRAVGSGGFSLFYTGTAQLPNSVTAGSVEDQSKCDSDGTQDGLTEFNLEAFTSTVADGQPDVTVTYHTSLNDANIGINSLSSPYMTISNPQTVYARVTSPNGCTNYTSFELSTGGPTLLEPSEVILCTYGFNLEYSVTSIIDEVIADPTGYIFSFHATQEDADLNSNPLGESITLTETPQTYFVRVTSEEDSDCYNTTSFEGRINRIISAVNPEDLTACDTNNDGFETFSLAPLTTIILGENAAEDFTIGYYATEEDRFLEQNPLPTSIENTQSPQTIYVSFTENETGCRDYTDFKLLVTPTPEPYFEQDTYQYCLNDMEPLKIKVRGGFANYEWNTGASGPNAAAIFVEEGGTYTVTVTNEYGCSETISTSVSVSNIATIEEVSVNDFTRYDNSITVTAIGEGDYEYALDNETNYQDDPTFKPVETGIHRIYVRDKNGCGVVSEEVLVLDYPNFFTPNNDGAHDTWYIRNIELFPATEIRIFNRYGRVLKNLPPNTEGWDGRNYDNILQPSDDYWFTLFLEDGRTIRGHFALKR
ncbi:T9SS type B sorting domain-containing protein [Flavobacteriaceae bacterium TK19130]|nr:T9SS type B sorting domain-containing protein [Thermobacterium salinum]